MSINQDMQQRHFKNEYEKAHFSILNTASWLNLQATKALKPFNLSPQQFYVLRILWEVHPEPVTLKRLTEQMIDEMSNASRLVDKLKVKGWVEREAHDGDRRLVNVYITGEGLNLVEQAAQAFEEKVEKKFRELPNGEIIFLNEILRQLHG